MSQVTNLAFFRARQGQSKALGAALAALEYIHAVFLKERRR
jgi:hypothetical protein